MCVVVWVHLNVCACARAAIVRVMVGEQRGHGGAIEGNLLPQYFGLRNDWKVEGDQ